MLGYYKEPEQTREPFTADARLRARSKLTCSPRQRVLGSAACEINICRAAARMPPCSTAPKKGPQLVKTQIHGQSRTSRATTTRAAAYAARVVVVITMSALALRPVANQCHDPALRAGQGAGSNGRHGGGAKGRGQGEFTEQLHNPGRYIVVCLRKCQATLMHSAHRQA
jgi:hypothetical protein